MRNLLRSSIRVLAALLLLLPAVWASAQQRTATGTICDIHGETLPGVAVRVKGTSRGVISDLNGAFAIAAEKGDVLLFSYIGFITQEREWDGTSVLSVTMKEDVEQLDEVVVTAIGIKQVKRQIGYSTQQIKTDVLDSSANINLGNDLTGQVAGLRVTNPTGIFQAPSFSLRGRTPLIVVDGIPVSTDMYDIPSSAIESVNVLKGTAASALYGARGRDGALIITTKTATRDGVSIEVDLSSMVTAGFTVFPETQHEFGSGSLGKYEFWDGADGGISDGDMTWGPKFVPGLKIPQWNSPIRNKETGEVIEWWGDVAGTIYDDKSRYERVPIPFEFHDNLRDFLRTGVVTKGSFAVSSRTSKTNTYFSSGLIHQRGQVPNTSLSGGNLMLNHKVHLAKGLTFDFNSSYSKVFSPNYPRYGYGPKNHMYSILLWMSDDVDGQELKKHLYRPDANGYRQANYNYAWYNNPYFMAYEEAQSQDRDVYSVMGTLLWTILDNLTLRSRSSLRSVKVFEDMKVPKSYMNYGDSREGDYKTRNTHSRDINADLLLSYEQKWLEGALGLEANVGASILDSQSDSQYLATDGLVTPFVYSTSNSAGPLQGSNSYRRMQIRSLYGRVGLGLMGHTFANFTWRNDRASTLSKEHNSYFYPALNVSTVLSDYIRMPEQVTYLKAYGSWAVVSNALDPYRLVPTYDKGSGYGNRVSITYPAELVNREMLPERTTSYELGLSCGLFGNRLSTELVWFHNRDDNQILNLPISEATFFDSRLVNGNVFRTNGFEVMVSAIPVLLPDRFRWDVSFNFSGMATKLAEIYGGAERYGSLKVGDRADAIYDRKWETAPDGSVIIDLQSGQPYFNPFPQNVGNANPDFHYGLRNTLLYKGFKLDVNLDGAIGGTIVSTTIQKMWWAGKHPSSAMYREEEYETGKPVYVPDLSVVTGGELKRNAEGEIIEDTRTFERLEVAVPWQTWAQNYPYRASVSEKDNKLFANTYPLTFLKLRHIGLGYDLAQAWDMGPVKSCYVSLFGENLFVLKQLPYLDPDFGSRDNDLQDPSARYVGLSLKLKF